MIDSSAKISKYECAYEYLFVVAKNASNDCLEVVKELCKNEKCRYIIQSNPGLGDAIQTAFSEVTGSHIIFWPADNDMDTTAFPEMVELAKNNPEKIITVSRWLCKDGFKGYGKIRKLINFTSQKCFGLLFKSELTDFTNPTQIAPLKIYRSILWEGTGFEFIPEMIFKPLKLGYEFIEVPCKSMPRQDGKTNGSFLKFAKYYPVIFKIYKMAENDILVGEKL